jgi:hypothetical protein
VDLIARSETDGRGRARGRASTDKRASGVSDRGEVRADRAGPALEDWGADRRLQGSEGIRTVRSRSNGGGPRGSEWVRAGPRGSERVRGDLSRSIKIGRGKIRWEG